MAYITLSRGRYIGNYAIDFESLGLELYEPEGRSKL